MLRNLPEQQQFSGDRENGDRLGDCPGRHQSLPAGLPAIPRWPQPPGGLAGRVTVAIVWQAAEAWSRNAVSLWSDASEAVGSHDNGTLILLLRVRD